MNGMDADFWAELRFQLGQLRADGWRPDFQFDGEELLLMIWPSTSLQADRVGFWCLDRDLWLHGLSSKVRIGKTFRLFEGKLLVADGVVTAPPT